MSLICCALGLTPSVAGAEIVMINVAVLVILLCIALAVVARLDFRER